MLKVASFSTQHRWCLPSSNGVRATHVYTRQHTFALCVRLRSSKVCMRAMYAFKCTNCLFAIANRIQFYIYL